MNLHCDALTYLKGAGGISCNYTKSGTRHDRLRDIHYRSAGICYRQRLRRGTSDSDVTKTQGGGAGRENSRTRRTGRPASFCGTGVASAARQTHNGQKHADRRKQQGRVAELLALRSFSLGWNLGGLKLGGCLGSHVTFSVESEGGRNYWSEAAIRSNRFRLFIRSTGQVPNRNGQAKPCISMKFPRKSGEIESLVRETGLS